MADKPFATEPQMETVTLRDIEVMCLGSWKVEVTLEPIDLYEEGPDRTIRIIESKEDGRETIIHGDMVVGHSVRERIVKRPKKEA